MSTRFGVPILAVLITVGSANLASAAYCGAANYSNCDCTADGSSDGNASADDGSTTVMVTRKKVVCVPEKYTAYRTVYDTVYEDKTINCTSYVRENRVRTVNYTVR